MLCAKRKSDGTAVNAYFEHSRNGPFVCLDCNDPVLLKAGRHKINHFAHINPIVCRFAAPESDEHRRCKLEIYNALRKQPGVTDVGLELPFELVRADVCARIKGVPVAIEVQISSLAVERIQQRTIEYYREGVHVLWLLQWTPELDNPRYAPKVWEKWLHALYFGRVYYWLGGLDVVSYSFEPAFKSLPRKTWHGEGGKKITAGGYTRRVARWRNPVRGETFNIVKHFVPKQRYWWRSNGLTVPDAKLFMDRN